VLYTIARDGVCRIEPEGEDHKLKPLFDEIIRTIPAPQYDPQSPLQMLVLNLDYSEFVAASPSAASSNGTVRSKQDVGVIRHDGNVGRTRVSYLYGFRRPGARRSGRGRPRRHRRTRGFDEVNIGDTITDPNDPRPLARVVIDERPSA